MGTVERGKKSPVQPYGWENWTTAQNVGLGFVLSPPSFGSCNLEKWISLYGLCKHKCTWVWYVGRQKPTQRHNMLLHYADKQYYGYCNVKRLKRIPETMFYMLSIYMFLFITFTFWLWSILVFSFLRGNFHHLVFFQYVQNMLHTAIVISI